jgi:hypothetical protein
LRLLLPFQQQEATPTFQLEIACFPIADSFVFLQAATSQFSQYAGLSVADNDITVSSPGCASPDEALVDGDGTQTGFSQVIGDA